jgi:hypothetical protein
MATAALVVIAVAITFALWYRRQIFYLAASRQR